MGFIMGCLLLVATGAFVWGLLTKKEDREKTAKEFTQNPLGFVFTLVWVGCCLLTFVGVFVPVLGTIEVLDSDWELWQVTGIGALIGFVIFLSPFGRKL